MNLKNRSVQISRAVGAVTVALATGLVGNVVLASGFTAPPPTTQPNNGSTQQPGSQQNAAYVLPGGGGGNASQAGQKTSAMQMMAKGLNVAAAGMYTKICVQPHGTGTWACPMAAMAAMQAINMGNASGQSEQSGLQMAGYDWRTYVPPGASPTPDPNGNGGLTNNNGPGVNGGGPGGSGGPGAATNDLDRQLGRTIATLKEAGVQVSDDGKTIKKDGRSFDLSKGGGSEKDLLAMGLSASEASAAMDASNKFAKANADKFKQASQLAGGDGGGGGGGGRMPADVGGTGRENYGFAFGDPRNRPRPQGKVSGLTRKLGEDNIGVSQDNIFEMVTRQYKSRDQANFFLKD